RELALAGRHLVGGDAFPEQALVRVAADQGRPGIAALEQTGHGARVESPFNLAFGTVARDAIGPEDRQDVALERDRDCRGGGGGRPAGGGEGPAGWWICPAGAIPAARPGEPPPWVARWERR